MKPYSVNISPNKTQFPPLRLTIYKFSTLKTSRAFDCKAFISPNHTNGKSSIHIVILYTCVSPQDPSSGSFLAVKVFSHPAVRMGSHSFTMPHNNIYRARTIVLAVKIISHPAIRMGNHSFIMPHSTYRARTRRPETFSLHPTAKAR